MVSGLRVRFSWLLANGTIRWQLPSYAFKTSSALSKRNLHALRQSLKQLLFFWAVGENLKRCQWLGFLCFNQAFIILNVFVISSGVFIQYFSDAVYLVQKIANALRFFISRRIRVSGAYPLLPNHDFPRPFTIHPKAIHAWMRLFKADGPIVWPHSCLKSLLQHYPPLQVDQLDKATFLSISNGWDRKLPLGRVWAYGERI